MGIGTALLDALPFGAIGVAAGYAAGTGAALPPTAAAAAVGLALFAGCAGLSLSMQPERKRRFPLVGTVVYHGVDFVRV